MYSTIRSSPYPVPHNQTAVSRIGTLERRVKSTSGRLASWTVGDDRHAGKGPPTSALLWPNRPLQASNLRRAEGCVFRGTAKCAPDDDEADGEWPEKQSTKGLGQATDCPTAKLPD